MKQRPKFREDGRPNFVSLLIKKCEELLEGKVSFDDGYQVEFRLNGVDVPFNAALQALEEEARNTVEKRAQELSDARVEHLFSQLDTIAVGLERAFEDARDDLRRIGNGAAEVVELDENVSKEDFLDIARKLT